MSISCTGCPYEKVFAFRFRCKSMQAISPLNFYKPNILPDQQCQSSDCIATEKSKKPSSLQVTTTYQMYQNNKHSQNIQKDNV